MTESTKESENYDNLKFVRLRGSCPDDIIGFVTYKQECIVIYKPLIISVETFFEESRQIVSMQEYLPQNIVNIKEVEIPSEDILFVTPINKDFVEQYDYACQYFYTDEASVKKKNKKESLEEASGKIEKVVSILEAMQAKKDKPVH
jgi:hypothetical protein